MKKIIKKLRQGFTLVEMISILVLLSVIFLIMVPGITKISKNSKDKMNNAAIEVIESSALDYVSENKNKYIVNSSYTYCITLDELINNGNLTNEIISPLEDKSQIVNITFDEKEEAVAELKTTCNENISSDNFVLVGNKNINIEVGTSSYIDEGAIAKNNAGQTVAYTTSITNLKNKEVTNINTLKLDKYIITYTAVLDGVSTSVKRYVNVVDTTAPIINTEKNILIKNNINSYNLLKNVLISDNSGEAIKPKISTNLILGINGLYYAIYTAIDSSGNTTSLKVKIKVTDDIIPTLLYGLIPAYYDEKLAVWKVADETNLSTENEWFDYSKQKWANGILTTAENLKVGDIIPESTIESYYVWIPRFSYVVGDINELTDLEFSTSSEVLYGKDGYYTHPSFTSTKGKQLKGFWVSKYVTLSGDSLPNVDLDISSITKTHNTILESYELYSEVHSNFDKSILKSTQYGAISYLANSKYGRCQTAECIINNAESNGETIGIVLPNNFNTGTLKDETSTTNNYSGIFNFYNLDHVVAVAALSSESFKITDTYDNHFDYYLTEDDYAKLYETSNNFAKYQIKPLAFTQYMLSCVGLFGDGSDDVNQLNIYLKNKGLINYFNNYLPELMYFTNTKKMAGFGLRGAFGLFSIGGMQIDNVNFTQPYYLVITEEN